MVLLIADGALVVDEPGRLWRRVDVTLGRPGDEESSSRGGSSCDCEDGLLASWFWLWSHDEDGGGSGAEEEGSYCGRLLPLPPGEESMVRVERAQTWYMITRA